MPIRDLRERLGSDWWTDLKESYGPGQLTEKAKTTVNDLVADDEVSQPTKVYKWTDANGQVHYGDKPQNAGAEQVEVSTRNAISAPDNQAHIENEQPETVVAEESPLEKAKAAAEAMKARIQQQESN